jgi:hypothetical protein
MDAFSRTCVGGVCTTVDCAEVRDRAPAESAPPSFFRAPAPPEDTGMPSLPAWPRHARPCRCDSRRQICAPIDRALHCPRAALSPHNAAPGSSTPSPPYSKQAPGRSEHAHRPPYRQLGPSSTSSANACSGHIRSTSWRGPVGILVLLHTRRPRPTRVDRASNNHRRSKPGFSQEHREGCCSSRTHD